MTNLSSESAPSSSMQVRVTQAKNYFEKCFLTINPEATKPAFIQLLQLLLEIDVGEDSAADKQLLFQKIYDYSKRIEVSKKKNHSEENLWKMWHMLMPMLLKKESSNRDAEGYARLSQLVRALLAYKHDKAEDKMDGRWPQVLHEVFICEDVSLVKFILKRNVFLPRSEADGSPSRHVCDAAEHSKEVLKCFVDEGYKMDLDAGKRGDTPLHAAAATFNLENMRYLIAECRVNVNALARDGRSALDFALNSFGYDGLKTAQLRVAKFLVASGANVNAGISRPHDQFLFGGSLPIPDEINSLYRAVMDKNIEAVWFLIQNGVKMHDESLRQILRYLVSAIGLEMVGKYKQQLQEIKNLLEDCSHAHSAKMIYNILSGWELQEMPGSQLELMEAAIQECFCRMLSGTYSEVVGERKLKQIVNCLHSEKFLKEKYQRYIKLFKIEIDLLLSQQKKEEISADALQKKFDEVVARVSLPSQADRVLQLRSEFTAEHLEWAENCIDQIFNAKIGEDTTLMEQELMRFLLGFGRCESSEKNFTALVTHYNQWLDYSAWGLDGVPLDVTTRFSVLEPLLNCYAAKASASRFRDPDWGCYDFKERLVNGKVDGDDFRRTNLSVTAARLLQYRHGILDKVDNRWPHVLDFVLQYQDVELLQFILERTQDLPRMEVNGCPSVHVCNAAKSSKKILECFVRQGFKLDVSEDDEEQRMGNTPLHVAAAHNKLDVVVHLVEECGVTINAVNEDGRSALDCALLLDASEVVDYLRTKSAQSAISTEQPQQAKFDRKRKRQDPDTPDEKQTPKTEEEAQANREDSESTFIARRHLSLAASLRFLPGVRQGNGSIQSSSSSSSMQPPAAGIGGKKVGL